MATKMILHRKTEWANRRRTLKVFIDQVEKGKIADSGSEEYLLEPGSYAIQCKVNWCSSPAFTFEVKDGETKFLKVRSAMKFYMPLYILAVLAILAGLVFNLTHQPQPSYFPWLQLVLVLPFALYLLFYLTMGKNQYLLVEEDKDNIFN